MFASDTASVAPAQKSRVVNIGDFVPVDERTPPQNIDAEEAIIGGILLDPNAMERVDEVIGDNLDAFYVASHRLIYQTCQRLYRASKQIDPTMVAATLGPDLEKAGGMAGIAAILDRTLSAVNVDQYAHLIMEKWFRRKVIQFGTELRGQAFGRMGTQELKALVENAFFALMQESQVQESVDYGVAVLNEIEDFQSGKIQYMKTGFNSVNRMLSGGGFQRGQLVVIGGKAGTGKSAMVGDLAWTALNNGHPVDVFSMEMSRNQWLRRMISLQCNIPTDRLIQKNGVSGDKQWEAIGATSICISDLQNSGQFKLHEDPHITLDQIRSNLLRRRKQLAEQGKTLDYMVLDYLQLMPDIDGAGNEVAGITKCIKGLKRMAMEFNMVIFVLSQLNRSFEGGSSKRPTMSALMGASSIEANADIVILLYRDELYNPDTPDKGVAEFIIAKQREGRVGTIRLGFRPHVSTRFFDIDD